MVSQRRTLPRGVNLGAALRGEQRLCPPRFSLRYPTKIRGCLAKSFSGRILPCGEFNLLILRSFGLLLYIQPEVSSFPEKGVICCN